MNWGILSALLAIVALSTAEQYTDRYDNINYEEILTNKRLLSSYVKCVLDSGRCTAEGKELKAHIQDAIKTGCEKCTPKQQEGARKVVSHLKEHEKETWQRILQKYDPENKYKEIYEAFLAKENDN